MYKGRVLVAKLSQVAQYNKVPGIGVELNMLGVQRASGLVCAAALLCLSVGSSAAIEKPSAAPEDAKQIVQQVVNNEIAADKADHSRWMYRDAKKTPEKSTLKLVVQTGHGDISKLMEVNGKPPDSVMKQQDLAHRQSFIADPSMQQKQARDHHDDDQKAAALMKMLPSAFLWTKVGEENGEIRLKFKPDPKFVPPTRDARVFAAMAGTMTVAAKQMRLISLKGALTQDVDFGWGILGRLRQGGTFNIERREIGPGEWQIVETHVHINGRALLFKSIDQNEDEVQSGWRRVAPNLSLAEAAKMLDKPLDQSADNGSASPTAQGTRVAESAKEPAVR